MTATTSAHRALFSNRSRSVRDNPALKQGGALWRSEPQRWMVEPGETRKRYEPDRITACIERGSELNTVRPWSYGAIALPVWFLCLSAYAEPDAPPVSLVQASNVPCKVGRPNVKPGEAVAWNGQCAGGLAAGRGTAQWSDKGKPTLRFDGVFTQGLLVVGDVKI